MRRPSLSGRDRRALLAGAVLLVPVLAWTLGVAPYIRAVAEARERLRAERELLARELGLLAAADAYPAAFEEGGARLLAAALRLFGGENDGAAAAALARYLEERARSSRVLLVQVDPIAAADAGGITELAFRVRAETDLEGLLTLLSRLGSGTKLVRIESLQVGAARRDGRTALDEPESLSVRFAILGYALGDLPAAERVAVRGGAGP